MIRKLDREPHFHVIYRCQVQRVRFTPPDRRVIEMSGLRGSALLDAKYWVDEAQRYAKSRESDIELAKVNAMIALAEAVAKLADKD